MTPSIRVYRSSRTPLFEAVDRVRRAMRNYVRTEDFAIVPAVQRSHYLSYVSAYYLFERERVALRFLASRDVGHHTSGWFKNPDYERCEHLSLSCWDAMRDNTPIQFERGLAETAVELFFVHHFRVFCDAGWRPILPRGEVYTREFTEAGWLSWSDRQAAQARS